MKYVEAAGVRVSAIGVGCWQFGSREWGYGKDYASNEAVDIIHRALDLGVNMIDTAEAYAFGQSERIVGRAIEGRRSECFIATKMMPVLPLAAIVAQRGRASKARLGIDVIDLYQLHQPNPVVPLSQQTGGLRQLQKAGVIAHAGVSNYSLSRWKAAESALGGPIISNQVQYSLVCRAPDTDLVPWAAANDRIVIAYSPLGQGLLGAKYDEHNTPSGVRAMNPLFLPENLRLAGPLLTAFREIAAAHDATPSQVALAWVIRRPNVVAIPGASSVQQLEQNVAAADLDLTDDEDARLTAASDAFHPRHGLAAAPRLIERRFARR